MSTKTKLITSESKDFEDVLASIQNHQGCRDEVSSEWVKRNIKSNTVDYVLIIGSLDKIYGFACLANFRILFASKATYVEIKLMCTEKNNLYYGYDLLLHIIELCHSVHKKYILLDAIDTAVGFYRKFGFKHIDTSIDSTFYYYNENARHNAMFLDVENFDEKVVKTKVAEASLKRDYSSIFK